MGEFETVSTLVKGMCKSMGVQPPPTPSNQVTAALSPPVDFSAEDEALAKLVWLGYPHEQASEGIRVCKKLCGSVDADHVAEYLIRQTEESIQNIADETKEVKTTNIVRSCRSNGDSLGICDSDEDTSEEEAACFSNHSSKPVRRKGKTRMDDIFPNEDEDDDEPPKDRWITSDANSTLEILVEMGFTPEKVEEAIRQHGLTDNVVENVSSLANYIVTGLNNIEDGLEHRNGETSRVAICPVPKEALRHQELEVFQQLIGMGFDAVVISRAIDSCGDNPTAEEVVEHVVGGPAMPEQTQSTHPAESGETINTSTKLDQLLTMGYSYVNCRRAVDTYGLASICELCDFLDALGEEDIEENLEAEKLYMRSKSTGYESDDEYTEYGNGSHELSIKKRNARAIVGGAREKRARGYSIASLSTNEIQIHRNRTGFGLPGQVVVNRYLPPDIARPPYFYFENVENMPVGEWANIRRHLFNIEPELMDALNFSACRRPRGYVHNLPIEGREDILPRPPMTVKELMGNRAIYWPDWDKRVKLNTICTRQATNFVEKQIKGHLQACEERGYPLEDEKKIIMYWARKWNLVWIQANKLVPLRPEEVEVCLGFDVDHTRVLYSPGDRIKVLGNSFQVNTVAYQLSVLKTRYPTGMKVISLFSGIGGAEVALHKLGISLKVVVSVEIDEKARTVLDCWWKISGQKGLLIHDFIDVKLLDTKVLMALLQKYQGFDLVIGGSPCNNLSGNNRTSRVGLQGSESIAFFEFPRILNVVRDYMGQ